MSNLHISNPKRKINLKTGKASWFDYYAGYSTEFVEDIINFLDISRESIILDPWNGSGTTTQVSSNLGYKSIGFDINPVMIIVSIAKNLDMGALERIKNEMPKISSLANEITIDSKLLESDLLNGWLHTNSIRPFRKLEESFLSIHGIEKDYLKIADYQNITPIIAFYYVALFKTVKELLSSFKSSNPTWIKRPRDESDKITLVDSDVNATFFKYVNQMISAVDDIREMNMSSQTVISLASSEELPLTDSTIDVVIASPPYCTRIDYAIATILELSILGYSDPKNLKNLRSKMIGTPTVNRDIDKPRNQWGTSANKVLARMSEHESKASYSYYYKIYFQYFNSIYNSLQEIDRVLKNDSYSVFVIQNSYYKDFLIDLSMIFTEMASEFSWYLHEKASYKKNTLAGIHKGTKKYRDSSSVEETVLIFKKTKK